MPTMSGRTTVGIGLNSGNVLLGQQYELAPFDGTVEIGCIADRNLVSCAIFSGPDILQQPGGIVTFNGAAATELTPKYPDDYHWEDEVAKGDRLSLSFQNGNAAITIVNWAVRLTPA
jgi:hypothetical protein